MPLSAPGRSEDPFHNFIDDLIDGAKTSALKRGAKEPGWSDIWLTLLDHRKFGELLSARNVQTSGMALEIGFMERFMPPGTSAPESYSREEIRKALTELVDETELVRQLMGLTDNLIMQRLGEEAENEDKEEKDGQRLYETAVNLLAARLRGQLTDADDEGKREATLKMGIIKHAATAPLSIHLEGAPPEVRREIEQVSAVVAQWMSDVLVRQPLPKFVFEMSAIRTLEKLRDKADHPMARPTAIHVFDFIVKESGKLYEDLLYRNGMRSDDPDRTDALEGKLPAAEVQSVMMGALREAYRENARELTNRHILFTLLEAPSVQRHLSILGIKDLEKFSDKADDILKGPDKEEDEGKRKIAIHPRVPDQSTFKYLDAAWKAEARHEELLLALMQADPAIDKALNRAGLRRNMLADWRKKYDAKEKKGRKEKEKKKPRDGDKKITEAELNELTAEYCTDYTKLARRRKFDPMVGNADLIGQLSMIVQKRGKKNPILIAEPGVGKTKVLEGFSQAIARGQVPKKLVGARVLMLDLDKMNDTPYIGVFENRFKTLVGGIAQRNAEGGPPTMIFIDEFAETLDTGGHAHSTGFKGVVKPFLTRGDVIMLSATTLDEYRTKVEKDPALARRMQPVFMKVPTDDETAEILKGIKSKYERHHGVSAAPQLLTIVAKAAGRYIHTVNQPDKSIDLLDESLAYASSQGERSLKKEHVMRIVSSKTNIPFSHLSENDRERYANLETSLSARVLAQGEAVRTVSGALKRSKEGFKKAGAPIGNFIFVGPTGVGKTELAKAIDAVLTGNETQDPVRFDMSEYMEKHAASRFVGAPPGYVGYEEGGLLVKTLRNRPFGVYLYDEAEKAHPDVFNALLAPLSDGVITDGLGKTGNMRDVINIFTSNLGATAVLARGQELGLDPVEDHEAWQKMSKPIYLAAVRAYFRPEFLNRMDGIICFDSLRSDTMEILVERQAGQTKHQLQENRGLSLELSPDFARAVMKQGFDITYGARPLQRAWKEHVETPLADWLLKQKLRQLQEAASVLMEPANDDSGTPRITLVKRAFTA